MKNAVNVVNTVNVVNVVTTRESRFYQSRIHDSHVVTDLTVTRFSEKIL